MLVFKALFPLLSVNFALLPALATPLQHTESVQRRDLAGLLSSLCKIKPLNVILCGSQGASATTSLRVQTPLGTALGTSDSSTVGRFSVRYASSKRWQESTMATDWQLPNNATDPSTLPLACPQPSSSESSALTDEDCLSLILYVPAVAALGKIPTMMWIHGGSFMVGSATGPGLDGAALADATSSIIAVVQYRLGAFGFLSPSGESNLAVKDMMVALQFLRKVLPSFNGDASKVTIAGQSTGATMVRALLAAPLASELFKSASLHSDPMDYGFLTTSTFGTLNNFLISQLPCPATDISCLDAMSTDEVLNLSLETFGAANSLDAAAGQFMPLRPVMDGQLLTSPLDATSPFPSQSKSIVVSTVQDEAGPTIYSSFTSPLSATDFAAVVNQTFGPSRTTKLLASPDYAITNSSNNTAIDARVQLEVMGTDQIWRCPSWTFARAWQAAGGTAYVGEYALGATYPDNSAIAFCTDGAVCHEDDIEIVFGTARNPSSAQKSLIEQIQSRLRSFLSSENPNANGAATWTPVSGNNTNALAFGGSGGAAPVGACDPGFWGSAVPFDYQLFND